jgi:hypothetical protein
MNIHEALYALGVRDDTLTQMEKDTLDRNGYLPLPNILTPEQVKKFGARLDDGSPSGNRHRSTSRPGEQRPDV